MYKKIAYILIFIITVTSCKTTKVGSATNLNLSTKNVIKNHYNNAFKKETINAKLKVKYVGKTNLPSVTASLRIKKSDTIWISLTKFGIPVGRALITTNRVSYYNKFDRTYFDGNFYCLADGVLCIKYTLIR